MSAHLLAGHLQQRTVSCDDLIDAQWRLGVCGKTG
jgi:hypothetical protein